MTDRDNGIGPAVVACMDLNGHRVYVCEGGVTAEVPDGPWEPYISIGVRDTDTDDDVFDRDEYREVIDVDPIHALLSREDSGGSAPKHTPGSMRNRSNETD
jgi:hypothetical protein